MNRPHPNPRPIGRPKGAKERYGKCIRFVSGEEGNRALREFAAHLRTIREELDVPADELAAAVGVDVATILHWESGRRVPKLSRLYQISAALGVQWREVLP